MEPEDGILGFNDLEDVSWLCSLSEPELDILISIKKLAIHHAKMVGNEALAKKFDLKNLRATAFVLMEYLKGKMKGLEDNPKADKLVSLIEDSNLISSGDGSMSLKELEELICHKSRKRRREM